MKIRTRLPLLGEVQAARARVTEARIRLARTPLGQSAPRVEARARSHPLACVGVAAGLGAVLGWCAIGPWRVLEVGSLISTQAWPWATRLAAMARSAGLA